MEPKLAWAACVSHNSRNDWDDDDWRAEEKELKKCIDLFQPRNFPHFSPLLGFAHIHTISWSISGCNFTDYFTIAKVEPWKLSQFDSFDKIPKANMKQA